MQSVFKASGWESTNTKISDASFEFIELLEDAQQCGNWRAKANLVAASAFVKDQHLDTAEQHE